MTALSGWSFYLFLSTKGMYISRWTDPGIRSSYCSSTWACSPSLSSHRNSVIYVSLSYPKKTHTFRFFRSSDLWTTAIGGPGLYLRLICIIRTRGTSKYKTLLLWCSYPACFWLSMTSLERIVVVPWWPTWHTFGLGQSPMSSEIVWQSVKTHSRQGLPNWLHKSRCYKRPRF